MPKTPSLLEVYDKRCKAPQQPEAAFKLCVVYWADAYTHDEWTADSPEYKEFVVRSIGWIREFKDGYVLTPHMAVDQEAHKDYRFGDLHIPKGCVLNITELDI